MPLFKDIFFKLFWHYRIFPVIVSRPLYSTLNSGGNLMVKLYYWLLIATLSLCAQNCVSQQYGPISKFELSKPLNSPPIYLSVLMTEKEFESPATEMTGLQKNDVAQKILHNWNVADEFKGSATRLSTIVDLTVSRYGKIISQAIVEKSKKEHFDRSVKKAIEDSEPFPSFPLQVKENQIMIKLIFSNKK